MSSPLPASAHLKDAVRHPIQWIRRHDRDIDASKSYKHENDSEAHKLYRQSAGHKMKHVSAILPQTINPDEETVPGIQHPGSTGVIYCSDRAQANGFNYASSHKWANLGQGAPEVGPIPEATERPLKFEYDVDTLEYAPTTGVKSLREAVANLYNTTYRQGKASQYTYENVCIVPGGRAGLSRIAAVIGDVYCSYQVPDYTAYDQMLSAFKRLLPIPTALLPENRYNLDLEQVKKDIDTQGLAVIIASNPRNPTGQIIQGNDLKELVDICHGSSTTVILDEFYSWYIYHEDDKDIGKSISCAEYVEDVNQDSVIIVDGLTKGLISSLLKEPTADFDIELETAWLACLLGSWSQEPDNCPFSVRYVYHGAGALTADRPVTRVGSFLDGGANHPLQLAAVPLLDPQHVAKEKIALQKHFKAKRDHILKRLKDIGLEVTIPPVATFYIWLNLENLPEPINNGLTFFEELLKEQTIVIPGIFFDINPSHRRNMFSSPCHHFVRLSFGPPLDDLNRGIDAMERVVRRAKKEGRHTFGHSYRRSVDGAASLAAHI